MILHKPRGLGHPYRTEPFERTPHFPTASETITFRVSCDPGHELIKLVVKSAQDENLELDLVSKGPAFSVEESKFGKTAKEIVNQGHLEDAALRSGEYSHLEERVVELQPQGLSGDYEYWFESASEKSEVFQFSIHEWVESEGYILHDETSSLDVTGFQLLATKNGDARKARFKIQLGESTHIVGLGERFDSVQQNGKDVDAVVYEEYKGQGQRTYLPVPFFHVVGANMGVHVKTSTPSRYSFGNWPSGTCEIEVDLANPTDRVEIDVYSGNPDEVLKKYLQDVGEPVAPPAWIYDLWLSSNEWNTQSRVERELAKSAEAGIQPSVVVLEAWSDESTFTVFRDAKYKPTDGKNGLSAEDITYPADGAWPDPKAMIDELHAKDIRLILWQIPVLKDRGTAGSQAERNWDYALQNNYVIKDEEGQPYRIRGFWFQDGLLPDLSDEKVRAWWADQRRYLMQDLGVDGFKTDGGEHAWGQDLQYLDGSIGLEKNNLFPVHYAQTFHELYEKLSKHSVTFSRAGFTGSQKYPSFWAGDENSTWNAFRASINAGISASASGFYHWGWDIGGFSGDIPTVELYLRSVAAAAFAPIMQIHSEFNHHRVPSNDRTPWNIAERFDDPDVLVIFKRFLEIRKRLLPYIVKSGELAIETGRPIMAGLFFDHAEDPEIWKAPHQFKFGSDVLVAPVLESGATTQRVYLPEGNWTYAFNQTKSWSGQQWVEVPAPLSEAPVFVKTGSEVLAAFN